MRALVALLLGAALASCGGDSGPSQAQLCMEGSNIACDRIFDCAEGESLRTFVGGTKDACHQTVLNFCTCGAGQTYHSDQAQICADGLKATTCASLTNLATAVPAACSMVCTDASQ
jgi:hypothetical protein